MCDIYIMISRKCPKPGPGRYIAVLEAKTASGKTGTLTISKSFDEITPHQLEYEAVNDSLHRFKRHASVKIHSDHGWFETIWTRGWFNKWQQAGWIVKGKPAAGSEILQEIYMIETVCGITIESVDADLGAYRTWLSNEIERSKI